MSILYNLRTLMIYRLLLNLVTFNNTNADNSVSVDVLTQKKSRAQILGLVNIVRVHKKSLLRVILIRVVCYENKL